MKNDRYRTMEVLPIYSLRLTKAMFTLYVLCSVAFTSWPVILYFWSGEIETPLPLRLPRIDISSKQGYIVMASYDIFMVFVASLGLGFLDGTYSILTFNLLVLSGLIKTQMHDLNEMLVQKIQSKYQIHIKFRNIINMHREMKE